MKISLIGLVALFVLSISFESCGQKTQSAQTDKSSQVQDSVISDDAWKLKLTHEQYYVLRQKGTERAFTGQYWDHHEKGNYNCAGCKTPLFSSVSKFDSGTGWPSYYEPLNDTCVVKIKDDTQGMSRIEVICNRCGGHLGHVFDDGPAPTGLRYCINSISLQFEPLIEK